MNRVILLQIFVLISFGCSEKPIYLNSSVEMSQYENCDFYRNIYLDDITFEQIPSDFILDFQELLNEVSSCEILLTEKSSQANQLGFYHVENFELPRGVKEELLLDPTSFYLDSDGSKLSIASGYITGFLNAMSFLLKEFGYRFLGYSDNWIHFPDKLNRYKSFNGCVAPTFKGMHYSGTGGVGEKCGESIMLKKAVEHYNYRNGFIEYSAQVGHSLQAFYKENKEYIDAHPEIMADYYTFSGKKNDDDLIRDVNLDSPLSLPLLKRWFEKKLKKDDRVYHISISPPDGMSNKYAKLPSSFPFISNVIEKYMFIANEVGKHLKEKFPNWKGKISYPAYGNGTQIVIPPAFNGEYTLENFFLIQLIPYAFQADYKGFEKDENMINDWTYRYPDFQYTIYDYWDITQWSCGVPNDDLYTYVKSKLPLWKETVSSFSLETTYYHPVIAPHLWVAKEYMQGYADKSIDQLYEEYFLLAYGEGAGYVSEMYANWSSGFNGESEMPYALDLLAKAYAKVSRTKDTRSLNRIIEMMAYLHYQIEYFDVKSSKGTLNHTTQSLKYERYAKKMDQLCLMQTWTAWAYNYGEIKPWGYKQSPEPFCEDLGEKTFLQLKEEILDQFMRDKIRYPIQYKKLQFKANPERMRPHANLRGKFPRSTGGGTYEIISSKTANVSFTLYPKPTAVQPNDNYYFTVKKENQVFDNITLSKRDSNNDLHPYTYNISMKKGEVITLEAYGDFDNYLFDEGLSVRFVGTYRKSWTSQNGWYIYVPKEANEIVWTAPEKWVEENWQNKWYYFDVDGRQLEVPKKYYKKIAHNTFKIPSFIDGLYDMRGKINRVHFAVWNVEGNRAWDILNFEKIISYTPFEYSE